MVLRGQGTCLVRWSGSVVALTGVKRREPVKGLIEFGDQHGDTCIVSVLVTRPRHGRTRMEHGNRALRNSEIWVDGSGMPGDGLG
jgi:hypothetical protein